MHASALGLFLAVSQSAELHEARFSLDTSSTRDSLTPISADLSRSVRLLLGPLLRADATLDCRVSRLARSSARPSVRLFLLARAVIRRSTLAVAVATVARSSRIVAAAAAAALRPPPGSPLPLGRRPASHSSQSGRRRERGGEEGSAGAVADLSNVPLAPEKLGGEAKARC